MSDSANTLPQIVIVGAGFGGLWAAGALARAPAQIIVIDERNYHLFQPLLYQVATAGLSPADIAAPIRGILSRQRNARVVLGRVIGIDKETAGAIAELVKVALARDFRAINPTMSRIILIEAGPRVLPSFAARLSSAAHRALKRLGVEVRLGQPVTRCDEAGVMLDKERVACGVTIWAAGVMASPAAQWLAAEHDRAGRVMVDRDLSLPGHPEIFVIGDTASVRDVSGKPLPDIATVAKQEGKYLARLLRARLAGRAAPPPFRYRDYGELATVGRNFAVVDFHWLRLTGRIAWFVWSVAHIYFLIGFRNRLVVAMDWIWAYLTFQRGARLITASESDEESAPRG